MNHKSTSTPELFAVAISLTPDERRRYLDEVCSEGTKLRDELDRLIESHERAHDFLESPPIALSSVGHVLLHSEDEVTPARIGNYTILKVLGAGGMGRVYLAESEKPRRRVALKVIKPGTASSAMLRRFEQEAQVVALLQHPGIAQIFEAGTAVGSMGAQPYIAMEFVDGPLLTEYIKQRRLNVHERLILFCKVCDAVMHAHQKGVIHRDLKPANILVDTTGQPKVLDFGVARLTDPDTRSQTLHTHAGQLIGTLAYMSPEQVEGEPGKVDSRSDVYALGVILYELLTGKLPHDVNQHPIPEAIRIIREDTPTSLSNLDREYRGDIETIVGKALDKEPDRRYQSAKELADDIRRSLRDEPIVARRPSTWYQFRKFAKRNKALVGSAAASFVALAIGLLAAISQAHAADLARDDVEKKRQDLVTALAQVQSSLDISKGLNEFLEGIVKSPDPDEQLGRDVTVLQALERSERDLLEAMPTQLHVRGAIHRAIGQTYRSLAEYNKAEQHLRSAYELHKQSFGALHEETIRSHAYLNMLLSEYGKSSEGLELAASVWDDIKRQYADTAELRIIFASSLGAMYADVSRLREALALAEYVALQRGEALGPTHPTTLNARYTLAKLHSRHGEYAKAVEAQRSIVEAHRASGRPTSIRSVIWFVGLGNDLYDAGNYEEASKLADEIIPLAEQIFKPGHPGLLAALNLKATCMLKNGQVDAAVTLLQSVVDLHRQGQTPKSDGLIRVLGNLGAAHRQQGNLEDSAAAFKEAYELAVVPGVLPSRSELAAIGNYATALQLQRRFDEAMPLTKQLVQAAEQVLEPGDWTIAAYRYTYGKSLFRAKLLPEAHDQFLQAESHLARIFGENDERLVPLRRSLVDLCEARQRPDEASKWRAKLPEQYR